MKIYKPSDLIYAEQVYKEIYGVNYYFFIILEPIDKDEKGYQKYISLCDNLYICYREYTNFSEINKQNRKYCKFKLTKIK